ncbi:MAG: hypothetical protein JWQ96_1941 [Segetibacter sp.]|nr:hypothetical protein [Segetibacter sp.]
MEKMNDLKALLKHEIQDLYSAEEQIIEAMPLMIEKAKNSDLKKALKEHLKVTEKQLKRLDKVQKLMGKEKQAEENGEEKKGIIASLFSSMTGGSQKCKGMEGLITEGEKVMKEDMSPEVMDAAIIACSQKIEHYEICGYGTAKAYARELDLGPVAELLEETLNEEYQADDRLTDLAVSGVNKKAEAEAGKKAAGGSSTGERKAGGKQEATSKNATPKAQENKGKSAGSKDNTSAPKKAASLGKTKASGGNEGPNAKAGGTASKSTPKKANAKAGAKK